MARIRSVKPDFWTDAAVMRCKPLTRLLFLGMFNFADDYGRLPCVDATIKAQILPGEAVDIQTVKDMLAELSGNGMILLYSANGREYLEIVGWDDPSCSWSQKIDKRQQAKHPSPAQDVPPTSSENPRTSPTPTESHRKSPLDQGRDRTKDRTKDDSATANADRADNGFEEFFRSYPRRDGDNPRSTAERAYSKALKTGVDQPTLLLAAQRFARSPTTKVGTEFVPQAATWLNQKRWERWLADDGGGAPVDDREIYPEEAYGNLR